SLRRLNFLNMDTSQLFVPGSRITSFGALPTSPRRGGVKAEVLNQRSGVLSSRGGTGFPVIHKRAPSPPPVISGFPASEKEIPRGVPLTKAVTPESCQPSKIPRAKEWFQMRLAFGRSHV